MTLHKDSPATRALNASYIASFKGLLLNNSWV